MSFITEHDGVNDAMQTVSFKPGSNRSGAHIRVSFKRGGNCTGEHRQWDVAKFTHFPYWYGQSPKWKKLALVSTPFAGIWDTE